MYLLHTYNIFPYLVTKQGTEHDNPDEHVYQGPNDFYQPLRHGGKPTGGSHWEPPSYQGLTKGATEEAWGEGEVYTNPSMYQDLTKNETNSNENLPAYHPLVKPSTVCKLLLSLSLIRKKAILEQ